MSFSDWMVVLLIIDVCALVLCIVMLVYGLHHDWETDYGQG